MKKFVALLLTVALLTPLCALAEDVETAAVSNVTANAVAESENVYKITAPYSGVLLPFDLESGDSVSAGDTLFALDTVKVYAPVDGTVQAVFAETGDLCEDVTALYGMIACIERTLPQASTSGAYNDEENRLIHVGETVYFYQTSDKDNEGEGRADNPEGISPHGPTPPAPCGGVRPAAGHAAAVAVPAVRHGDFVFGLSRVQQA